MGKGGGDEGEEMCVYFRKPVQIHAGTFNYRSHPSYEKVGGAVEGEEEGLTHGIHRPRKGL